MHLSIYKRFHIIVIGGNYIHHFLIKFLMMFPSKCFFQHNPGRPFMIQEKKCFILCVFLSKKKKWSKYVHAKISTKLANIRSSFFLIFLLKRHIQATVSHIWNSKIGFSMIKYVQICAWAELPIGQNYPQLRYLFLMPFDYFCLKS